MLLPSAEAESIFRRMRVTVWSTAIWFSIAFGCGGTAQPADTPDRENETESLAETEGDNESTNAVTGEAPANAGDGARDGEQKAPSAAPAEPAFTPDMSVEQAQAAIPVGTERQNIEPEALGRPLQEPGVFDACNIGSAKFKVRVAVWNGKAVGIDLETTPKNPALAECLKARVRELTWPDKVRSLNTVEFQF